MIPNTYLIGVQKAGTTSLHYWLSQHPDIYAPMAFKDTDYFANPDRVHEIIKRFKKDYAGHKDETIILQSYVNYFLYKDALVRIKHFSPKAKLIVILRNPEERVISAYRYLIKMDREKRSPEDALLYKPKDNLKYSQENNDFTYLEHGLYGKQLQDVYSLFDPSNVIVLQFETLQEKPEQLTKKVFEFLGVDASFVPIFHKKNQTGNLKSKWLQNRLMETNPVKKLFVKIFLDWWLPVYKRQLLKKRIIEANTSEKKREQSEIIIPKEIKERIKRFYEKDQKKLKELLSSVSSSNKIEN